MKTLQLLILLSFLGSAFSGCAQTSFIKKATAFVSETSPGTEMVDDNGNPVVQKKIVTYTVYVEFTGMAPEWKHAWYNNQMFVVHPTEVQLKTMEVGIDKATGKKITIERAKGTQLWQLELVPGGTVADAPLKAKGKELILQGRRQQKVFRYRISKMIELLTPDAS